MEGSYRRQNSEARLERAPALLYGRSPQKPRYMSVSCVLYETPASLRASSRSVVWPETWPEPEPEATHCVEAQPKTLTWVQSSGRGRASSSFLRRTSPSPSMRWASWAPARMVASFSSEVTSILSPPR